MKTISYRLTIPRWAPINQMRTILMNSPTYLSSKHSHEKILAVMTRILMLFLFPVLLLIGMAVHSHAQSKTDVIIMLNGERKVGEIIAMQPNTVDFKYAGENLKYEILKEDINKIQFSSGRIEVINDPAMNASSNTSERKNKIAVLPFQFISNEAGLQPDQMSKQLQNDLATSLRENTSNIFVQDPLTTNRLLAKNKININDDASNDPKELAIVLGVEYLVFGTVDVLNKGSISTGSAATTYKDKESQNRDRNSKQTKSSGHASTTNNTVTSTNYVTKVSLNIYNDQGSTYYAKSRNAFGNQVDSYSRTFDYLIKRAPFGTKSR